VENTEKQKEAWPIPKSHHFRAGNKMFKSVN
jgi:hypothetical protein